MSKSPNLKSPNLECGTFSQKGEIPLGSNPVNLTPAPVKIPKGAHSDDFVSDLQTLSKTALRNKYRAEESCHKNMLRREQSKDAVIHPLFRKFDSFLSIMGPMPQKGMTVDRIDNADPEYAPDKVRWADKSTQNSNKSDSHAFTCSKTGQTYTTSQLAKAQDVTLSAIRKRRTNGWSDDEIIAGNKPKPVPASPKKSSRSYTPVQSVKHFAAFSVPPLWGYPRLDFPEGIYNTEQRHRICYPTMDDYGFSQDARYYQHQRQYGDGEYLPMTKSELIRSLLEDGLSNPLGGLEDDGEERHFVRSITGNRHLYFPNLPEHLREIIRDHDPEWLEKMELRFQKLEAQRAMEEKAANNFKDQLGDQI